MSKLYYLFFADLSGCQLIQVPDAIYFMMKDTQLTACNLSSNVITKIPPKFPNNFNFITELNLSHNRMSTLPEEISKCTQLETVDISNNSFVNLPNCLFNLPKIIKIIARKNFIAGVYTLYYKKTSINYFRKKKKNIFPYISIFLQISEVDIDLLTTCDGSSTLETLNLEENPLSRDCQDNLGTINSIRISITPREMEEWEDLSI